MDKSLDILIQKCKNDDRSAQGQIFKLYGSMVFSICRRYASCYEDAQDLLQEIFIHIFKKINQFENKGSFEGWIKRISINFCLEQFRKKNPLLLDYNLDFVQDLEEDELQNLEEDDLNYEELLSVVQSLPEKYKIVFNLYVMEDFSHQDIAKKLNISVGTSKSNLSRARQKLQSLVSELKYQLKKTK